MKHEMKNKNYISIAFEELAQSLRILLEANFNAQKLIFVDKAEAIGNIETAVTNVLNSFASLYDAINKQLVDIPINWYSSEPLSFILAIRNARHHNHANRIRILHTYHNQESENPQTMTQYILVNFPAMEEGAHTFEVYLSWSDLNELITHLKSESKRMQKTGNMIWNYLNAERFSEYSKMYNVSEDKIFFNLVPLIVNAAIKIVPLIQEHCNSDSIESTSFRDIFLAVSPANTIDHEVNCGPFVLP